MAKCEFAIQTPDNPMLRRDVGREERDTRAALVTDGQRMPICNLKLKRSKTGPLVICTKGGNPAGCPELFGK